MGFSTMNKIQLGTLLTGIVIMFFFGYGWSLETLRTKQSLYRLIKTGNRHSIVIVLNFFGFFHGHFWLFMPTFW